MFAVLIAVVLITAVVVTLNIEMSLENRIRQEVMDDIAQNPALCNGFSSMDECIDYYVDLRMKTD